MPGYTERERMMGRGSSLSIKKPGLMCRERREEARQLVLTYRTTSTYLPTNLPTYLTTDLPSHPPTYLPYPPTHPTTYPPTYLPTSSSLPYLPTYLPTWLNKGFPDIGHVTLPADTPLPSYSGDGT